MGIKKKKNVNSNIGISYLQNVDFYNHYCNKKVLITQLVTVIDIVLNFNLK